MSTSKSTLEYFLECLDGIPDLRAQAMFGEYGIYAGDRMFALACDNALFFKTSPETIEYFSDTTTRAYPGSRNTAPCNPEWFEDREKLRDIARLTISLTPIRKPRKPCK